MSPIWGIWLAAIASAAIYSYLLGDNDIYKLAEHVFVGAGAGHSITAGFANIRDSAWKPLTQGGSFALIIPVILGIMLYARFTKKYAYLSRWALALMVGVGTGVLMRGLPSSQIIQQLRSTMLPLNSIDNVIIILGTLGSITYFLFTLKAPAPVRALNALGRWAMMVCFGASFGAAVSQRTSQAAATVETIIKAFRR